MMLRLLGDRRDKLPRARPLAVNRTHRLFLDLVLGGAPVTQAMRRMPAR